MVHFWIMDRKSWTQGQTVLWLYNKHVMLSTPGGNRRYFYYKDIFVKNGNAHVNFCSKKLSIQTILHFQTQTMNFIHYSLN